MKRILIAFDGPHCSPQTIEYAADLAKSGKSLLMGCFISDLSYQPVRDDQDEDFRQVLKLYEHICRDKRVPFVFHKDTSLSLPELLDETLLADLLIVDTRSDNFWHSKNSKSYLYEDLLSKAKCPVLTMLSREEKIQNVFMMSDEKISNEYAVPIFG